MLLAALQNVEKVYGDQVVLEDASIELRDGSRIALIGRNGSGKSTILRLLIGLEEPDAGTVFRADDARLAMLDQDPVFDEGETVRQVADRAFAELDALEERLRQLETAGLDDPERYERWEHLHLTFERRGGYARRARRDAVLDALGFAHRHLQPVRQLSGGERTRLGLARLLMAQPDVLLLDEPTNHLDIDMRGWLEGYLSRYPGAALIVSHDRAFLDGACSRTAEVQRGELRVADGNPTAYRAAREEAERIQAATRANQERELSRLDAAAAQMRKWAGQSEKLHRRARAMERRAERYENAMVDELDGPERNVRFRFDCDESGAIVLTARHMTKRFANEPLFENVTVELRQGDRVALVGPNGAGKTTFLRMLLGDLASDDPRGEVRTGARVRLGYYDQELRGVDPDATLFEELHRRVGNVEAHNLLGRFLFPYDAQFKRVRDLSGGERARLSLLELTLGRHNLLVLDEPTNHLDVEMIEALEAALRIYQGTLLLVSHDRRFLEALATQVWEVRAGRFQHYEGDWAFYQRKRAARAEAAAAAERARKNGQSNDESADGDANRGPSRWQLERRRETLEDEIAGLERAVAEVVALLAAPQSLDERALDTVDALEAATRSTVTGDGPPPSQADILASLGSRHATLEQELLARMQEWQDITDRLGDDGTGAS
jgi:ATP-binding cassette, subfamily F, member 3